MEEVVYVTEEKERVANYRPVFVTEICDTMHFYTQDVETGMSALCFVCLKNVWVTDLNNIYFFNVQNLNISQLVHIFIAVETCCRTRWLFHRPLHQIPTCLRSKQGLSDFWFPFNSTLTLWTTIISTTLTFPLTPPQPPLPLAKTNQRTSSLLLLLNDRNTSHHPFLSAVTGGGKERTVWRWEN